MCKELIRTSFRKKNMCCFVLMIKRILEVFDQIIQGFFHRGKQIDCFHVGQRLSALIQILHDCKGNLNPRMLVYAKHQGVSKNTIHYRLSSKSKNRRQNW